jgi:hypothetical protein
MLGGKNAFANSMFINLSDISYNDREMSKILPLLTLYFLPCFFPYCIAENRINTTIHGAKHT